MFTLGSVTIRPLELEDIDLLYQWHQDYELDIYSAWGPRRSRAEFAKRQEERILEPPEDLIAFGVVYEGRLAGRVSLQLIDWIHRRAEVGILLGDRSTWGKGVGSTAVQLLLDYAFTVENLERVYAEVYDFNVRSQRLFERLGFVREGTLRSHELHNGARRDMYVYGMLKDEFYARYQTLFRIPKEG